MEIEKKITPVMDHNLADAVQGLETNKNHSIKVLKDAGIIKSAEEVQKENETKAHDKTVAEIARLISESVEECKNCSFIIYDKKTNEPIQAYDTKEAAEEILDGMGTDGAKYVIREVPQDQLDYIINTADVNECNKVDEEIKKLEPEFDGRKSFYGKAKVESEDDVKVLYSYGYAVCAIAGDFGPVLLRDGYANYASSATTMRHVREFLKQNGYDVYPVSKMSDHYPIRSWRGIEDLKSLANEHSADTVLESCKKEEDINITNNDSPARVDNREITNNTTTTDKAVVEELTTDAFVDWHDHHYNDSNFNDKLEKVYAILDKHDEGENDVAVAFEKCSDDEKAQIASIIGLTEGFGLLGIGDVNVNVDASGQNNAVGVGGGTGKTDEEMNLIPDVSSILPKLPGLNESVNYKNRKELAEGIEECKANGIAFKVVRSVEEGYRYTLIKEAAETLVEAKEEKEPEEETKGMVLGDLIMSDDDVTVEPEMQIEGDEEDEDVERLMNLYDLYLAEPGDLTEKEMNDLRDAGMIGDEEEDAPVYFGSKVVDDDIIADDTFMDDEEDAYESSIDDLEDEIDDEEDEDEIVGEDEDFDEAFYRAYRSDEIDMGVEVEADSEQDALLQAEDEFNRGNADWYDEKIGDVDVQEIDDETKEPIELIKADEEDGEETVLEEAKESESEEEIIADDEEEPVDFEDTEVEQPEVSFSTEEVKEVASEVATEVAPDEDAEVVADTVDEIVDTAVENKIEADKNAFTPVNPAFDDFEVIEGEDDVDTDLLEMAQAHIASLKK